MFKKVIASQNMRRRVAMILFIFLVAPFAIYGVSSRRLSKAAGTVFGKSVSSEDYQSERAWVLRQLRNQLGEAADSLNQLEPFVNQTVWDRFILQEEARREHVRTDDQELAAFIREIPGFQDNGRFDTERYHRFIAAMGTSPQEFERHLRQDLTVEKLVNRVKNSVTVSDQDVRSAFDSANEQLTASVIFFDPNTYSAEAAAGITDEMIRSAYDAHPDKYRTKEQITFEYAGLSMEQIEFKKELSDADIESYYQGHLDEWPAAEDKKPKPLAEIRESVRNRMVDADKKKSLTNLSLDIQDDLDAKKTFDEITAARALTKKTVGPITSEDVWASGATEPAIIQAAAKLEAGESSGLVKTDQGVFIVKLNNRVPSHVESFEAVREQARAHLIESRARDLAKTKADAAHEYLKTQIASGAKFEEALGKYSSPLTASPWTFTRSGSIGPLGAAPAANEAAFAAAPETITDVMEAPTGFAIIKPEKRTPADAAKFAEAESKLRDETLSKRQSERTSEWLAEIRTRAKLKTTPSETSSEG